MDDAAIARARQFADTAFSAELERISRDANEQIRQSRARLAAMGTIYSGTTVVETAKINGYRITALLKAKLDLLLEGLELHSVTLDEELEAALLTELKRFREQLTANAGQAYQNDHITARLVPVLTYVQTLEQNIDFSPNAIRTELTRRRLMPKSQQSPAPITIFHVTGHNNRWVNNGSDSSVNVVTQSSDQVFATLKQEIESRIPEGEERADILARLVALEKAQGSPSFVQRYTEVIAAAANHMAVIGPFIPALTEMLHKVIS